MKKYIIILSLFGLTWGQTYLATLVLKKGKQILEFDSGQRLIINNDIKGAFESMNEDYISVRTDLSQKEIPISSITKIHIQDTVSRSFTYSVLAAAGIVILPIAILSIGNSEANYGFVVAGIATPICVCVTMVRFGYNLYFLLTKIKGNQN